ncbi:3-oxoacyl-reductase [Microthyrium microscopicum]|uniref:3-oxoacyl-reductase n=1 Tax=Microthyrium microscopicum TaxID=703497 RepID=A0A6A6U2C4_9PEZI|nr:3-oxoacyl-reductase [Microthyrium microscopicum]
MASFSGKVIAITGAASGMGLETAKLLASRGASLSLADVQDKALEAAKSAITSTIKDAKVLTFVVDVRDNNSVTAWINKTVETFGRLDGAANIAGVFKGTNELENETDENWNFILGINLTGLMYSVRAQVPHLKAGGSIVNAASTLGISGQPKAAAYASSKHGVIGLTRSVAKEVGKKGIRVNCFAPGYINTPMLQSSAAAQGKTPTTTGDALNTALGRLGEPSEVATLIAFLLSDESSFITGECITIDGGWKC